MHRGDDGLRNQLPFVRARDRFGRPLPRDGFALAQPGDGPRRPLQYLLELCSGACAWPAAAFFESDQGTGVDDSVGREAALTDVEFPPARGGGRPGAGKLRIDDGRRLSSRLRVCHYGDSSLSGVLRRVSQ